MTWDESEFHSIELSISPDHLYHLWKKAFRQKDACLFLCSCHGHHHGLGSRSGSVIHRSVSAVHAREFGYH